jgi:cold shock CspA family protein
MSDERIVDLPPARLVPLLGHVASFDDPRGIGVVQSGDRRFDFHCTAITDGTRRIAEGAPVAFTVDAGHLGRLQASSVRPLGAAGVPGAAGDEEAPGAAGDEEAPGASGTSPG